MIDKNVIYINHKSIKRLLWYQSMCVTVDHVSSS